MTRLECTDCGADIEVSGPKGSDEADTYNLLLAEAEKYDWVVWTESGETEILCPPCWAVSRVGEAEEAEELTEELVENFEAVEAAAQMDDYLRESSNHRRDD